MKNTGIKKDAGLTKTAIKPIQLLRNSKGILSKQRNVVPDTYNTTYYY